MTAEPDCVFCRIVAGEEPVSVFYEDDHTLGFMTIGPVNPGHTLVIPKEHVRGLGDLDEAAGQRMWMVSHRTAAALKGSGLRCEGVNLSSPTVPPRSRTSSTSTCTSFPGSWATRSASTPTGRCCRPRAELDAAALDIARAYEQLWGGGD